MHAGIFQEEHKPFIQGNVHNAKRLAFHIKLDKELCHVEYCCSFGKDLQTFIRADVIFFRHKSININNINIFYIMEI